MPQVPYKPVPQASAQMIATPNVRIDTPGAAFGTNIAEALGGVGRHLEQAGGEIFQRAIALQNLRNETEAKEADAKYMIEAGKLHAEFSSLQGKDAVDAYPKYIDNLKSLRTDVRNSLSNDMSRRMYDSASLSTMGRTIFNGAGHAATENKRWHGGASEARIDAYGSSVYQSPDDDDLYERSIRTVANEVEGTLAPLHGWGSEQTGMEVNKRVSKITSQRIIGMSRQEPFRAQEMFEKYKDNLHDNDRFQTENVLRNQMHAVGAKNIADSIFLAGREEPGRKGKPLREMESEAEARAKKISPSDPELAHNAVRQVQTLYNQDKYARKQEENENVDTISQYIIANNPRSLQELRTDPQAAAAMDALSATNPTKAKSVMNQIRNWAESQQRKEHDVEFTRLYGMSKIDPLEFLEQDVIGNKNLSQGQIRQLINAQTNLKKNAEADPRIHRALGWMQQAHGASLNALGIYRDSPNNHDEWLQYAGAMQVAIDEFQQSHKKPPDFKDITETIGPRIIQQRSVAGTIFGNLWPSQIPFYKQEVPKDFSEKIKADFVKKNLPAATDEEIAKAYLRFQYNEFYGKKDKK